MPQQLRSIEKKLTYLDEMIRAGGKTAAAKALDYANAYLKEKYPTMQWSSRREGKMLEFSRSIPGDASSVAVRVTYLLSGPPLITSD